MNDVDFEMIMSTLEKINERLNGMGKLIVQNHKELMDKDTSVRAAAQGAPVANMASGYQKAPKTPPTPEGNCPMCNKFLKDRTGAYGPFLSCSGYPECTYTFKLKDKK
jgi:hypothetical protein